MNEPQVSKDDSIFVIAFLGSLVAAWLSWSQYQTGEKCPDFPFTSIPACYIVLVLFLLVVLSRKVSGDQLRFGLGIGASVAGLVTAVWFSLNHLMGIVQCPKLLGIPLCFASFIVFMILLALIGQRK